MAFADLLDGNHTEPLSARALAGDRAPQPSDVLSLAELHGASMVDRRPQGGRRLEIPPSIPIGLAVARRRERRQNHRAE